MLYNGDVDHSKDGCFRVVSIMTDRRLGRVGLMSL